MNRPRRLLTIAHSYVVTMNRRLAHELAKADRALGSDGGGPDLLRRFQRYRPALLEAGETEPCKSFRCRPI